MGICLERYRGVEFMEILTSRFGKVSITEGDLITFKEGLLGFSGLRTFVILDDPQDDIFAWLQSCEDANVAFPVLEPELFGASKTFKISSRDLHQIESDSNEKCVFFNIITIPEDPTNMTANLKAPVVINIQKRLARQCVLQDNKLAIREPIFTKLQQRVVQNPSETIKSKMDHLGVTVKLPKAPEPSAEL